jgi:hypothetical protein
MPKKAKLSKVRKTIYLSDDVALQAERAANAEGMTLSIYVEQTLKARIKRESKS